MEGTTEWCKRIFEVRTIDNRNCNKLPDSSQMYHSSCSNSSGFEFNANLDAIQHKGVFLY
jgi:hypothetical protein